MYGGMEGYIGENEAQRSLNKAFGFRICSSGFRAWGLGSRALAGI